MSKEEILKRIEELEKEAEEIRAEQENINNLLAIVKGGRSDAMYSHLVKLQLAVNARMAIWNRECDILEAEARKLAA